jgi:hypothetical protein
MQLVYMKNSVEKEAIASIDIFYIFGDLNLQRCKKKYRWCKNTPFWICECQNR